MKALRGHFSGFQLIGDVVQLLAGVGSPVGGKLASGLHSVGCPPPPDLCTGTPASSVTEWKAVAVVTKHRTGSPLSVSGHAA